MESSESMADGQTRIRDYRALRQMYQGFDTVETEESEAVLHADGQQV